jgi:hypothetical protein
MEKTKVIIVKWKESKGQKERRKKSSFKSSKHKTKNVGKVGYVDGYSNDGSSNSVLVVIEDRIIRYWLSEVRVISELEYVRTSQSKKPKYITGPQKA